MKVTKLVKLPKCALFKDFHVLCT